MALTFMMTLFMFKVKNLSDYVNVEGNMLNTKSVYISGLLIDDTRILGHITSEQSIFIDFTIIKIKDNKFHFTGDESAVCTDLYIYPSALSILYATLAFTTLGLAIVYAK